MERQVRSMKKETDDLQLSLQRYTADDFSTFHLRDLDDIENRLQNSLNRVRARKALLLLLLFSTLQPSTLHTHTQIHRYLLGFSIGFLVQSELLQQQVDNLRRKVLLVYFHSFL